MLVAMVARRRVRKVLGLTKEEDIGLYMDFFVF